MLMASGNGMNVGALVAPVKVGEIEEVWFPSETRQYFYCVSVYIKSKI